MNRLSTSAFAMLVAATIAAFFITQHLKVTTPLIQGFPRPVPGVIDPLHGVPCSGKSSASTTISFYLQHRADTVDVYVVDDDDGDDRPHGRERPPHAQERAHPRRRVPLERT